MAGMAGEPKKYMILGDWKKPEWPVRAIIPQQLEQNLVSPLYDYWIEFPIMCCVMANHHFSSAADILIHHIHAPREPPSIINKCIS